jgi:hypothetical protein
MFIMCDVMFVVIGVAGGIWFLVMSANIETGIKMIDKFLNPN